MAWVIGIVVVLIIIGAISSAASKNEEVQKKVEFNEMARSRVDAYVDYLRRTSNRTEFARMTDLELKDMIGQKVRAYKSQTSGASSIGGFVFFLGACFATWQGIAKESWGAFFIWGVIAIAVAVGLIMFLTKQIDNEFRTAGFEPERLKVEE